MAFEELFAQLRSSEFRSSFHLRQKERDYLAEKGLDSVLTHARRFLEQRLAPAFPHKDGSQTPTGGHPVFVAPHATGMCCRSCLRKWHGIEKGRDLAPEEIEYLLAVVKEWLVREPPGKKPEQQQLSFFG